MSDRMVWSESNELLVFDSQCEVCLYHKDNGRCDAFPGGIPPIILANEHDHRKPYPGDNGIQFEPIKEQPE